MVIMASSRSPLTVIVTVSSILYNTAGESFAPIAPKQGLSLVWKLPRGHERQTYSRISALRLWTLLHRARECHGCGRAACDHACQNGLLRSLYLSIGVRPMSESSRSLRDIGSDRAVARWCHSATQRLISLHRDER